MEGEFYPLADQQKAKWLIDRVFPAPVDRPLFVFPVPANSPLLGTWKCVERSDSGAVSRTIIVTYSQNGVVEITFQNGTTTTKEKRNWKYTSKTATSGVEEDYVGGELVERDSIRWINSNQFETTIAFFVDPNQVGTKQVFTRQ